MLHEIMISLVKYADADEGVDNWLCSKIQPITACICHCFATAHTRETLCKNYSGHIE